MGDLKTNFASPILPDHGIEGSSVVSSGSDPHTDGAGEGPAGLQPVWPDAKRPTTQDGTAESANSLSGLPPLPNRFEPSGTPPEPPSLKDRNPGTIDQR